MPGNSAVGIQRRHCSFPVIWNPDADSTYPHFIEWHQAKPRTCPLCEAVSLASESCQFVESRQPYLGVLIIFKIFARKCEWWCQPILRVRPCRHRQHSLMRTARVRCAAHYGTITSRTPSGQTNGAYRTLWWPVLFSGDSPNRSYGASCGMVPRFCQEMGFRDQKVLR